MAQGILGSGDTCNILLLSTTWPY